MAMDGRGTAVGVFSDRAQAEQAVHALHAAGFTEEQVGFLTHDREVPAEETGHEGPSTTGGAVGGGLLGGVIGVLTSLLVPGVGPMIAAGALVLTLSGVVLGAAAGGLAVGLMRLGLPEEEAQRYQREIASGRSLVTVTTADRYDEAVSLLWKNGATNINTNNGFPSASGIYNAEDTQIAESVGNPGNPDYERDLTKTSAITETELRDESAPPVLFPTAVGDPTSGTIGSVNGPLVPSSDPVVIADAPEEDQQR